MKLYNYLVGAAAALMMCSCTEKAVDDLKGVYQAPEDITITSAADKGVEKEGKMTKLFNVDFTTATGDVLTMQFVGDTYFLQPGSYTAANYGTHVKGNFILEKSSYTRKGGGLAVPVSRGAVTIEKNNDDYSVTGTLWLADGGIIRMKGGGTIEYIPIDPTDIPELKSAVNNNDGTITATFTTGGYTESMDMTTYEMIYEGTGYDFQVTFYSPDGKLHPGIYAPGTGYKAGGQEEMEFWGQVYLVDTGTIWYTIADGKKVPTYITAGDIEVVKNGPMYTVTLNQGKGGIYVQYEGPIPALDEDGDVEAFWLKSGLSAASYAEYGFPILDIVLGCEGDVAVDENGVYSGNGDIVQLEIYSADGTLAPGEYKIALGDADFQPGTFRCGYDGWFGASGTLHNHITDGVPGTPVYITEGTLLVQGDAGTPRSFTLVSGKKVFKGTVDLTKFKL